MAKKRKASGQPFGRDEPREFNDADNKLRINTYEDVADSEDEFHINRDKILLEEGPAQKRQRKIQEDEAILEPSDEEVLASNEDVSDYEDDFDDARESPQGSTEQKKPTRIAKGVQGSESEVSAAPDEDEDTGGWGVSRKDYYNADTIETEADALEEEAEARRLQQKHLQGMTEADFGFDELEWLKAGKNGEDEDENDGDGVVREVLPKVQITDAMGPEERLRILRTRYPEFEPLAKEFLNLQAVHEESKSAATAAIAVQQHMSAKEGQALATENPTMPIAAVKHGALSAYLAALSMYFALLTSSQADSDGKLSTMPSEELRDHSIMETLVQCRDLWGRLKNLAVPELDVDNIPDMEESNGHAMDTSTHESQALKGTKDIKEETEDPPKRKKKHKSKARKAAEAAQAKADALRAERLQKTEEELASLSALTAPSRLSSKASKRPAKTTAGNKDSDSDFGEQTALTPHEAAEKAKRKKSLRFYTSQITQKANKRDAAGRDAGGDADLPYRERLKDRQARLNAEAEARGKKPKESTKGEALGGPSDEEDHAATQELRDGSGSEDYYDLVASRSADKKASKAALAAVHAQAEKQGGIVRVVEEETADGKRAISYAIEKNKGLAPRRKKDVRNPRVKKRKKFEEKKKKLGSIRQIYKGGEGRGGYGGEKTGISTRLVKSVKL
ncbi:hypothetical protein HO133_006623 [Letharia lupina]|uniref:Sas10 C-terminal domain-containing protein n=1 Tax=Letharia lupina TaxID=560253 RepID=A0A8H6C709_9LECA|nr:uncharacterized protein HO133_006623 [Letharia lupina]KAF6217796.1 hypothetical protein HO133_006623 [Letharia lupina]